MLSEGYQMMVNDSVEQSKSVADKYIEACKAKNVSSPNTIYLKQFRHQVNIARWTL